MFLYKPAQFSQIPAFPGKTQDISISVWVYFLPSFLQAKGISHKPCKRQLSSLRFEKGDVSSKGVQALVPGLQATEARPPCQQLQALGAVSVWTLPLLNHLSLTRTSLQTLPQFSPPKWLY